MTEVIRTVEICMDQYEIRTAIAAAAAYHMPSGSRAPTAEDVTLTFTYDGESAIGVSTVVTVEETNED